MLILGGQSTVNLGRIHEDLARITSDSVDPGGGQLTVTLGRIHEDLARNTSDSVDPGGIDQQSTWEGSSNTFQVFVGWLIESHLGKDP